METFRVAHLQNKFWTTNSIKVPNQSIVLDEGFKNVNDIWGSIEQKEYSLIQWKEFMVTGSIMLPGEWNYCFYNGKYFHLEKISSNGFIHDGVDDNGRSKGIECFFYQLIYDDWQNDWLHNRIYIKGTINLTGDKDLVKANLVQTTPLVNNVNSYEFLNGILGDYEGRITIKCPSFENEQFWGIRSDFSPIDVVKIRNFLIGHNYTQPDETRLVIPLIYKTSKWGDWKFNMVKQICDLHDTKLEVYDVSYSAAGGAFKPALEGLLGTDEVYTVAGISNRRYVLSKTKNSSKYIKEIDLTGVTNVVELDPTSLNPRYGIETPEPTFSISDLCRKVREKLGWGSELQYEMEEVAYDVLGRELNYVLFGGVSEGKLYRNASVEKIDRDIDYVTREYDPLRSSFLYDAPVTVRNPEWFREVDIIPERQWWKNGISEQGSIEPLVIGEFSTETLPDDHICHFAGVTWLEGNPLNTYKANIEHTNPANIRERNSLFMCFRFSNVITTVDLLGGGNLLDNKNLSWPITPKEKIVSVDGEIDFSRNSSYDDKYVALIPDYVRKCHVLAISEYREHPTLKWPESDVQNINSNKSAGLVVFNEVVHRTDENDIDPNNPPTNLIKLWWSAVSNGRQGFKLDDLIQRTKEFTKHLIKRDRITLGEEWQLRTTVKYKHYYSYCHESSTANRNCWSTTPKSVGYNHQLGWFRYRFTYDRGFNCHITIPYDVEPFFVRMFKKSFKQYLDEFNHLPDNVLSYTFINKNIKKGNMDNMYKTINDGVISQRTDNKDLLSIWFDINNDALDTFYDTWVDFFNSTWFSDKSYAGAIPWFSTLKNNTKKWEFCLTKPFRGFWYVFSLIGDYLSYGTFRFNKDEHNWLDVGKNGFTKNWKLGDPVFVANVPNTWDYSGEIISKHRYILKTTDVSLYKTTGSYNSMAVIAMIYGNSTELWGNNGFNDYKPADLFRKDFDKKFDNNINILLNNLVKTQFKTDRTRDPRDFKRLFIEKMRKSKIEIPIESNLGRFIPPFISRYLDPSSALNSVLHSWTKWSGTGSKITAWRERITKAAKEAIRLLSEFWTIFKLDGTEWFVVALINTSKETPTWEFELLTNNSNNIKSKDLEYWFFKNAHKSDDVDVLINSRYELNLYGSRNELKTRYFTNDDVLDIGLKVKALDDIKQTEASQWYSVELKTDSQDVIRSIIETPKEQVKQVISNIYERERLMREISVSSMQREADARLLDIEKIQFKKMDGLDREDVYRRRRFDAYMGGIDLVQGLTSSYLGFGLAEMFGSGGSFQAVRGALRIGDAFDRAAIETAKLDAKYQAGMDKFEVRGKLMASQHEAERSNYMDRLREASAKVSYPQLSNALAYKIYNNYHRLNDVYLVKYYPSGELLEYLKNYYLEYGYEILVRNFECTGADCINRHLRYTNIHILNHPKERVRNMIETRALNGIYKINWEQRHY